MKITDIIRTIIDIIDHAEAEQESVADVKVTLATDEDPVGDELAVIQQLAGLENEPEYANKPQEIVAPLGAAFPGGDDVHQHKNPADIRSNSISMYPAFQAEQR